MTRHLHVALGPVQAFVAQSRRTRDLWGSSYLLSFLSAHAIRGAAAATRGRIVRPIVEGDPMMRWIDGDRSGDPPRLGSIPNQFAVELADGDDPSRVAEATREALVAAWQRICRAVWDAYVARVVHLGDDTAARWERQLDTF